MRRWPGEAIEIRKPYRVRYVSDGLGQKSLSMCWRRFTKALLLLLTVLSSHWASAADAVDNAVKLARSIDRHLATRWSSEQIAVAPPADDCEFLRRAYVDLTGRIPRPADVYEFLADDAPDKRAALINRLLDDPRFAIHQANSWRAELIPEAATDRQAALLQPGFENWLIERIRSNVRYDQLVRELIAVPLPGEGQAPEPVLRDPQRPNPLAYIAAKNARPEQLAAAVTRTFLGVRLQCAECHDHPFASWTQEQFWQQAAFFGGLQKHGASLFAPLSENVQQHSAGSPHDQQTYHARWLDGGTPAWADDRSPRQYLADWITSPDNSFFARAGANRIWGQLFGRGLVEPVDDFHDGNPASDALLLDELARAFIDSGFDLRFLIRGICLTDAYQRTSALTHSSQDRTVLPARMTVKALTGEQFFDSLALATGYEDEQDKGAMRRQLLNRFARAGAIGEPETSVQQALTLMNGRFTGWATDPERCPTLVAVTQLPGLTLDEQMEALYMTTLSRPPSAEERSQLRAAWSSGEELPATQRCADMFWMLLNSAEFRLNH